MSMTEIENLAHDHAVAINALAAKVSEVNAEIEAITKKASARIQKLVAVCIETRSNLVYEIENNTDLFEKPRTQVLSGIKVGFVKGKDTIAYVDDADKTCALIAKHYPDMAEALVKTKCSPVVSAIQNLPPEKMKKIGVTVVPGTDDVVATPTDGAVHKLVAAHLKQA